MALPPIDLSPFRMLVDFFAGAYFALVSIRVSSGAGTQRSLRNWIEFVEPDIGMFGLGQNWTLPDGEAKPLAHGYHVMSGNNISSPFGTLNLVNLGKVLAANPDEERTNVEIDYVLAPRTNEGGRPGFMRCEVYRGPPMADIVAHLDSSQIYNALGDSFDTMRAAFQYRRDGVMSLIGEYEEGITVPPDGVEGRMRIRIPVVGDDHIPVFELI